MAAIMGFCIAACSSVTNEIESGSTAAQTEAPTSAPTPEPPAGTPVPVYPTPGKLGKLCEGPIFPEPAKYLVLKGESDLYYVYDDMGELVRIFSAESNDLTYGQPGFFGEDGICVSVRISTGEKLDPFNLFGDIVIRKGWYEVNGGQDREIRLECVMDSDFNELFSFKEEDMPVLGDSGGVLHLGGGFLVICRNYNWYTSRIEYTSDPVLYDEHGNIIRTVDPTPFGLIYGVFGEKYVIGGTLREGFDGDDYGDYTYSLYDLNGDVVMKGVKPERGSVFCPYDESGWGYLVAAYYLTDSKGVKRGPDLNEVDSFPAFGEESPLDLRYGNLFYTMEAKGYLAEIWEGVYAGVRTKDGKWTFKIYNPRLGSDTDAERTSYGW